MAVVAAKSKESGQETRFSTRCDYIDRSTLVVTVVVRPTWFHPVWDTNYQKSHTWYKTYAIVGSVSIPTYKKCYAGAIFEFSENNGASQKKDLYYV